MSLWRRTRTEVAGAWRSLRYDMGRRPRSSAAAVPSAAVPAAPDVTSTGMSTFGGVPAADLRTGHDGYARPPRRVAAVAALGVLAVVGAAGTCFAVVNGLGAAAPQRPAGAGAYPLAAAAPPPADTGEAASNSGLGGGPAPRATGTTGTTAVAVPARTPTLPAAEPPPARPGPRRTGPARPSTPPGGDCDCRTPPVPTPTAPPAPAPTPSATGSGEPGPSEIPATPSDSPSAPASGTAGGAPARQPRAHR